MQGVKTMKTSLRGTKDQQQQGDINRLITPEMRQQLRELKDQFDEHLLAVGEYCDRLNEIRKATFIARQTARCVLTDDPFEVWEKIHGRDEFDGFLGLAEEQPASRNYPARANVDQLITPQMRLEIVEAVKKLDEYASCLGQFIDDLNALKTFNALQGPVAGLLPV
jgi:hypothetical protein